jgi:hypothetical protein
VLGRVEARPVRVEVLPEARDREVGEHALARARDLDAEAVLGPHADDLDVRAQQFVEVGRQVGERRGNTRRAVAKRGVVGGDRLPVEDLEVERAVEAGERRLGGHRALRVLQARARELEHALDLGAPASAVLELDRADLEQAREPVAVLGLQVCAARELARDVLVEHGRLARRPGGDVPLARERGHVDRVLGGSRFGVVRDLPLELGLSLAAPAVRVEPVRDAIDAEDVGGVERLQPGRDVLELRVAGGGEAGEHGAAGGPVRRSRGIARGPFLRRVLLAPGLELGRRPVHVYGARVEHVAAVVE